MFKKKKPAPPVPRSMDEIQSVYQSLCNRVGQSQYQVHVYQLEVEKLNKEIYALNQEGAERQRIDAEAAAKAPPKDGTPKASNKEGAL